MAEFQDACAADELLEGQPRHVQLLGVDILLCRVGGQPRALENLCTHDDFELHEGRCEGEEIECPIHGARFSLVTGAALTPPAFEDLRTFPVREENGRIQVKL